MTAIQTNIVLNGLYEMLSKKKKFPVHIGKDKTKMLSVHR